MGTVAFFSRPSAIEHRSRGLPIDMEKQKCARQAIPSNDLAEGARRTIQQIFGRSSQRDHVAAA